MFTPWYIKNMNPDKKDIIDYAFTNFRINSFVDLGGTWAVEGAYTFYIMEKYKPDSAVLVDFSVPKDFLKRKKKTPNLTFVKGDFGQKQTINQLHKADAILMFDILLHQVSPDWNEILEIYSHLSDYILILNQQYKAAKTIRLLDLGEKEYFANVPHNEGTPRIYDKLFEKLDEFDPESNKKWRDSSLFWQWGITNKDLITVMESVGFSLEYLKNCGKFGHGLKNFDNYAFLFRKTG